MVNKIFIAIFVFVFLACLPQIYASLDVELSVNSEFLIGDLISFDYTISSDTSQNVQYAESIYCSEVPKSFLDLKSGLVDKELKIQGTYNYINVTKNILSQECNASIIILSPVNRIISKQFSIISSLPLDFNLVLDKKVFVKGEEVKIDYISNVKGISLEIFLIGPNGNKNKIDLPYSFNSDEIGTYTIEVNASKNGYKSVLLSEQFGVIEDNLNLVYVNVVNKVDSNEALNLEKKQDNKYSIKNIFKYFLYFLVLVVIVIIVLKLVRKYN